MECPECHENMDQNFMCGDDFEITIGYECICGCSAELKWYPPTSKLKKTCIDDYIIIAD